MNRLAPSLLFLLACGLARAELVPLPEVHDHVSPAERHRIWRAIDLAASALPPLSQEKAGARPAFQWPLRAARGYAGGGYHQFANFVDHDAAGGAVRDFQCGVRSYDRTGYNHQGTDFALLPDSWGLMARGQVEVVAAAEGTIAFREDGQPDQNCAMADAKAWNAVYVRHDDGSVAWYGHLKNGSVTQKAVGERVAAGEYLGIVGSSGSSTAPHLHFEVYDSLRRLVDPFAGQCNALNTESWWAAQPPYRATVVNRVVTASAPPVQATCSTAGTLANPGTLNEKSAFKPNDPIVMVAYVKDLLEDATVSGRILKPDGTVWRSWTGTSTQTYSGAYFQESYVLPPDATTGTWIAEATAGSSTTRTPFTVTANGTTLAHYTDLWWNANESGWGVNINHQGDLLFATWYTYDTDGAPLWLSIPDARRQSDGSFAGTLHRTSGLPFSQISGSTATLITTAVGSGTFRFDNAGSGAFFYTLNGVRQEKAITRLSFSTPTRCMATLGSRAGLTNYQDLWWNPSEPGWGVNIAHQGDILFATWYTYDAMGRDQWLSASDVRKQSTGEYKGTLYRTRGVSFDRIAGSPAMSGGAASAGELSFTFLDGERARMTYTLDGVTQSKTIVRFVVGTHLPYCQ